jgi:hypothetical protein
VLLGAGVRAPRRNRMVQSGAVSREQVDGALALVRSVPA